MISGLSFGAPWLGLLALLAVPAIVAIHFLQLPSRPAVTSTLFLLERLAPESEGGSRLERLRNSLPLWLQLLAALILAWLIAAPRWVRSDSMQTLVVVLDSSVSMRAFQDRMKLAERLRPLASAAARTEWLLIESDPAAPRLYRGEDLETLAQVAGAWRPNLGAHDPLPVLRLAQSLVPDAGEVIFVTDHPRGMSAGVAVLGIGEPVENVGFSGLRVTAGGWEALVQNHGQMAQEREWWIGEEEGEAPPGERQKLKLEPGEAKTLRGAFPASGRLTVVLEPGKDAFPLDDRLPVVRPVAKPLKVAFLGQESVLREWLVDFAGKLPETSIEDQGDLALAFHEPGRTTLPAGAAIIFVRNPASSAKPLAGLITAENHELTEGLSWHGLLVTEGARLRMNEDDQPLIWQGAVPLVFLRGERLVVNFDPVYSNATRLPAFVLLLHRFAERVRGGLPVAESRNVETYQTLAVSGGGGALIQKPESGAPLRAPAEPGFFEVLEESPGGEPMLRLAGAAHFADSREADFREAAAADPIPSLLRERQEQHSERDASAPFWLLLLGGVMVWNWVWQERRGHV